MNNKNQLRAWIYYRLSRDEDKELNSLNNQKSLLLDYAQKHNYKIVGESFDDNVSGMHFNRHGIDELSDQAEKKLIDVVLVKDLSRLGRHKTQTALFIDYLKKYDVNVYSVTENINTLDENDDLIIGFKGLINDSYAKDISKKIRHGFKQKQKEGIVIIPPFGYIKDKNNNQIIIVEECAEVVRLIFNLYLDGLGFKKIARYLNEHGFKSPSYYQLKFYNKRNPKNRTNLADQWVWHDRTVNEIIHNEAYVGTLICGKNYKSTIYHIRKRTSEEEQVRHENYYPPIIDQMTWSRVQAILNSRVNNNVRASSNSKIHKYAGLLKCGQCGATFVAKKRAGGIEYVCDSYHRRGKQYCTPHRIKERELDDYLNQNLSNLLEASKFIYNEVENKISNYYNCNLQIPIHNYQSQIQELSEENKNAIKQAIKYPEREHLINEIISDNNTQIEVIKKKIFDLENQEEKIKSVKKISLLSIKTLEEEISKNTISYSTIHLIVDKIVVSELDSYETTGELRLKVHYNIPYSAQWAAYTEAKSSCECNYSVIDKLLDL